jgi:hypothetical protein
LGSSHCSIDKGVNGITSSSSTSSSPTSSSSAANVHNKNINNNNNNLNNVFSDLLSNNNNSSSSSSNNNNQPINAKHICLEICHLSYFGELDISYSSSIINRDGRIYSKHCINNKEICKACSNAKSNISRIKNSLINKENINNNNNNISSNNISINNCNNSNYTYIFIFLN